MANFGDSHAPAHINLELSKATKEITLEKQKLEKLEIELKEAKDQLYCFLT